MTILTKRVMLLLLAVVSSAVFTFAPLMQQTAHAAVESPVNQLERWLYYRGMRACLQSPDFDNITPGNDNGSRSASEINDGHLLPGSGFGSSSASGGGTKEGFGYLAPDMDGADGNDGTVGCADGSVFYRGARAFGFPDVVHLVCAMNKAMSHPDIDDGGRIEPSHPTECVESDEFEFDGGSDKFQQALTKALESPIAEEYGGDGDRPNIDLTENDGADYDAKALYYLLGKRSLEVFCGKNAPIETTSEDSDKFDGDDDVVSVHVVQADGTIKKSQSYPLANPDRNESSTVNDVYWKVGGNWNEADDVTCARMAQWTRDPGNAEAFAAYIRLHPDDFEQSTNDGGTGSGSTEPVCSAGALGWVFCPLVDFISTATEQIAGLIESQLVYPPLLNREVPEGRAIQAIWGVVLGIANVALVIAFLIVIFSQATSVGISAYGIKRMLPRVIAAAVLMNLSFYICAVAVDIANIIGVSIKDIVYSGMEIISDIQPASNVQNGASEAQGWTAAIAGILGLGLAVATGAIFLLLPIILTALMAVLTALLVIAARQVIVTLLIIVAPLAILAWILPNTEQWFTKWRKLFTTMLLMFPLVMLIFYGSLLMSQLIMVTGSGGSDGDPEVMTNVIALAVLTVPLFSLPFIMKSAGGVLDRLGVMVNNRNKGLIDRTRKKAEEWRGNNAYQRGKVIRKQARTDLRNRRFAERLQRGYDGTGNLRDKVTRAQAGGVAETGRIIGETKSAQAVKRGVTTAANKGVAGLYGVSPTLGDLGAQAVAGASNVANNIPGKEMRTAQHQALTRFTTQAEREAAGKRRAAVRAELTSSGATTAQTYQKYMDAVQKGDVDEAAASFSHLATTFGGGGRTLAAEALKKTDLSSIKDESVRRKMATELDNTIGGELYGSLVGSRVDIAKGGFFGKDKFEFTKIDKLTAPQIATQDADVYVQGAARGEAYNADEAYLAMTNPELVSKITDSGTRQELSRLSGVSVRPSGPPSPGGGGTP